MNTETNRQTNVASYLLSHSLDFTRLDLRIVRFSNRDAAREAILCMRHDGMDLADIAKQAGASITCSRPMLRDMEIVLRSQLLGAAKGAVIGPIVEGQTFVVIEVCDKIAPSADDAELAALVEEQMTNTAGRQSFRKAA